jgi:hypothetical protein
VCVWGGGGDIDIDIDNESEERGMGRLELELEPIGVRRGRGEIRKSRKGAMEEEKTVDGRERGKEGRKEGW